MINDVHVHLGKQSMINQWLNIEEYIKFRTNFPYMGKTLFMGTDLELNNELIYNIIHEYDWAYGLYWWGHEQLRKIRFDDKLIGVKYHGKYNGGPVTDLPKELLEGMNRDRRILLVHCGRYKEGDISSNTSYLHALKIAHQYPRIKVILAHMGGTDTTVCMKAIEHGSKYHNVYFDTSGITTPYIIEYAVQKLPVTRILFGSDMPWCSFNAMVWTLGDAAITRLEKDDIFEKNFELLLK